MTKRKKIGSMVLYVFLVLLLIGVIGGIVALSSTEEEPNNPNLPDPNAPFVQVEDIDLDKTEVVF